MKAGVSKFASNSRLLACLFVLAGCQYEVASIDTTVRSRDVDVPVTYTHPVTTRATKFPLVVIAHGHGGHRHEQGSFTRVAEELARRGVASIRMDFPGCGDSTESFANNNLSNMLEDMRVSRDFARARSEVDPDRTGLFGWSMGGRLAVLTAAADESYSVVATWAPGVTNGAGSMIDFVGGPDAYAEMKAIAATDGFVPFTTSWGQDQQLGLRFFTDLEESAPLDAIKSYTGPLLVLYGDQDDVVLPEVAEALVSAATSSSEVVRHVIEGADHGLGVFSNEPDYTQEAVMTTVEFLADRL